MERMVSTRNNRLLVLIDATTSHSQLVVNNRAAVPIDTTTSYSKLAVNNRHQNVRYCIFFIVFIKNIFESMTFNAHN